MIEPLKNILYIARRFKLATAFNFLGLIVAFAAFYLMMTQVAFQATYNHGIQDCERLYRLDTDYMNNHGLFSDEILYPFADALNSLPEVESVSLLPYIYDNPVFASYYELQVLTKDRKIMKYTWLDKCNYTAVSTFISNKKVLSGNIDWSDTINDPYSGKRGIIIPKSIAIDYFGSTDVAGDSITLAPSYSTTATGDTIFFTIRGVYEDFPANSELQNYIYYTPKDGTEKEYKHCLNTDSTFKCYIKFKQVPNDVEALNKSLKQAIINMMDNEGWKTYAVSARMSEDGLQQAIDSMSIRLTPLKNSYFAKETLSSRVHGFKFMLNILIVACLLLTLIAAIHFLNFVLVESPMRIRGINTRLVLGASRHSLKFGIIAECVITSVIACVVALMLCSALYYWSVVNQLIDGDLAFWHHPGLAFCTLIIAGMVGIVAGLYPSAFVTSFTPAMALKGNFGLTPQGHKLRKAIIAFQLFISFLMVIYLGILRQEVYFIYHSEYGFNKDQVLISTVPLNTNDSTKQELYKKLTAVPGVKEVSFSDGSMGLLDNHGIQPVEIQGHSVSYEPTYVDSAYLRTMGIKMVKGLGRNFLPTDTAAAIINKATLDQWDWIKVNMKIPTGSDIVTIVGVCENIRYSSTRVFSDQPFIFIIEPESTCVQLNVGIENDANKDSIQQLANDIIQKLLRDTTGITDIEKKLSILSNTTYPTPLIEYDKMLEITTYPSEFRFFKWIFILSVVCTLITLIGVFCLMMFESEYRRKEIGIRKIVGATTGEVVGMLGKQYIPLILISFAAAAPIALLSGWLTLNYFKEHVPLQNTWWIFPLALVVVGGIVMATILIQSWRTARENPVNSIKSE